MNIPILLYHSISTDSSERFRQWTLPPKAFGEHLAFLKQEGYTPMRITDLVNAMTKSDEPLPERPVAITFDDGFADFRENAVELLDRWSSPATIYITSGCVGKTSRWLADLGEGDRPMMTWDQIAELPDYGVEIGAHSVTHPQLDTLNARQAFAEIAGSKAALEAQLGRAVVTFAYPHGYHSRETRDLVRKAGFTSACAVKHGMSGPADDPFALARIIVTCGTGVEHLASLLAGKGLEPVTPNERLRTTGWRAARRILATWNRMTRGRSGYGQPA